MLEISRKFLLYSGGLEEEQSFFSATRQNEVENHMLRVKEKKS